MIDLAQDTSDTITASMNSSFIAYSSHILQDK